jgi:hypothetical protein
MIHKAGLSAPPPGELGRLRFDGMPGHFTDEVPGETHPANAAHSHGDPHRTGSRHKQAQPRIAARLPPAVHSTLPPSRRVRRIGQSARRPLAFGTAAARAESAPQRVHGQPSLLITVSNGGRFDHWHSIVGGEAGRASCGSLRRPTESPQVRATPVIPTGSHRRNGTLRHTSARCYDGLGISLTSGNAAEQAMDALPVLVLRPR